MFRKVLFFFLILILGFSTSRPASACESCSCALARAGADPIYQSDRAFFDVTFEGQNWNTRPAEDVHELHEEGHHVHNKTHEEFYHFNLGVHPTEEVTLFGELAYIVRDSIEIEEHDRLGEKETSKGLGDMKLSGIWRFWRGHGNFLGLLGGVKLPTGSTEEENSQGTLFEPELQPGSGSTDASVGSVFQLALEPWVVHGNVVYTFKSEGDHDFEFGDLFSSYTSLDWLINPDAKGIRVTLGADLNWQIEDKQKEEGAQIEDSGGATVLMGPSLKIQLNDQVVLLGNFLLPAYQNLGGVHQELDFVWNASAKISW